MPFADYKKPEKGCSQGERQGKRATNREKTEGKSQNQKGIKRKG